MADFDNWNFQRTCVQVGLYVILQVLASLKSKGSLIFFLKGRNEENVNFYKSYCPSNTEVGLGGTRVPFVLYLPHEIKFRKLMKRLKMTLELFNVY